MAQAALNQKGETKSGTEHGGQEQQAERHTMAARQHRHQKAQNIRQTVACGEGSG